MAAAKTEMELAAHEEIGNCAAELSAMEGRHIELAERPPRLPEYPDDEDEVEVLLDGSTVGFVRRMQNRRWSVAPAILKHSVFGVHPTLDASLDAAQVADAIRCGWRDKEADLFVRVRAAKPASRFKPGDRVKWGMSLGHGPGFKAVARQYPLPHRMGQRKLLHLGRRKPAAEGGGPEMSRNLAVGEAVRTPGGKAGTVTDVIPCPLRSHMVCRVEWDNSNDEPRWIPERHLRRIKP